MLEIRSTTEADLHDVLLVEEAAFGEGQGPEIATLVNDLLHDNSAKPLLSLIAVERERPLGHILFTRAHITGATRLVSSVILAPLAVVPDTQSQGIGGRLIRQGLERLSKSGVELVFVLGYPEYYSRHGFTAATRLGFAAPYPIRPEQDDAWMVQALTQGVIGSVSGKIRCADALDKPEYWVE